MVKKIKIGFAPTRRTVFSREDSLRYKRLIEEHLRKWKVNFVNIDWLNSEGLLYRIEDAEIVAERFIKEKVEALFVPHCNFGTEGAVGLLAKRVAKPVLLWGPRDEAPLPDGTRLRDTQCGLFATSKVLRRLGVPFTYIVNSRVDDAVFERGFREFLAAASAANSFLGARIGQVSTRPGDFWTVMVNEGELLEKWGVQVVPTTLVDIVRAVEKKSKAPTSKLKSVVASFKKKASFKGISPGAVAKMAGLRLALEEWARAERLDAIALQCWSALQDALGIMPCFVHGELTAAGLPVSCETDIHGALSSLLLQSAAFFSTPTFFADLTIRHPQNDNAELLWHCGCFPAELAEEGAPRKISGHYILPKPVSGLGEWQLRKGDVTIARMDADRGEYSLFIGEARGIEGPFTRGTYLWVETSNWPLWEQKLIYGPYIHHVSSIYGRLAPILYEACRYIPGLKPDPVEPSEAEILAHWRGEDLQRAE